MNGSEKPGKDDEKSGSKTKEDIDIDELIKAQEAQDRGNGKRMPSQMKQDIQKFLHKSRMHLKPEDIRKAMENAKALGIVSDKKSKGDGSLMANANLGWSFRVKTSI